MTLPGAGAQEGRRYCPIALVRPSGRDACQSTVDRRGRDACQRAVDPGGRDACHLGVAGMVDRNCRASRRQHKERDQEQRERDSAQMSHRCLL